MDNVEAWLALVGTIFAGIGLEIVKKILGRTKAREEAVKAIKDELGSEIDTLRRQAEKIREEADELRDEIDSWRNKYYSLVSSIASGNLQEALDKIKGN